MRPPSPSTRLATGGVVLLGAGTFFLAYLAVNRQVSTVVDESGASFPSSAVSTALTSPSTPDLPAPASTTSTSPVASPAPTQTSVPTRLVLLHVVSGSVAWRATLSAPASCHPGTGATDVVASSRDAGVTWQPVRVPFPSVVRLRADSATSAWLIGQDATCRLRFASTVNGGLTWVQSALPPRAWYVDPATNGSVHVGAVTSRPCKTAVGDLVPATKDQAAVLCRDGSIRRTTDAGKSWLTVATVRHAVTMTQLGGRWLVGLPTSTCRGLAVKDAVSGADRGCAPVGSALNATLGGVEPRTLWASNATASRVSLDGGVTWGVPRP